MDTPASAPLSAPRVWACVVAYHPQPGTLRRLVAVLEPQVERVVVIDNAPGQPPLSREELGDAMYVPMPRNAGTAGAMNEAWRRALEAGATHVVSFDQDSQPGPAHVECLLAAFGLPASGPLAAVGPAWTDARSGKPMRLLKPVRFVRRHHALAQGDGLVEVDHVISSGCLISAEAYRATGPFDEELFLDYVDVEWSLRARARGRFTAVAAACKMTHAIGEHVIPLAGRQLLTHRPTRSYLQIRNHLLLWRRGWIPRGWLLSDLLQVCGKLGALLVLAPMRAKRLRCVIMGIRDGLRGRGGPGPVESR